MFGDDKYTYPGSGGVLRNLLGIEDADALDAAVNDLVTVAWAGMSRDLPADFDLTFLRAIHAELFGELFAWAGEFRDVELIATGVNLTYCLHEQMQERLDVLFAGLAEKNWLQGLDEWEFVSELSKTWAELTFIHPFRDGNTRTQSFFVSRLAIAAGHPIDWVKVRVEHLRQLRLSAVQGFPQNLASYLYDRLLDVSDLDPGYEDPLEAYLYGER